MQKFSLRIFKGTFSLMASQTGFVENDLSNATNNTVKAIYFSDIWKRGRYADNLLVLPSITFGSKELNVNNIKDWLYQLNHLHEKIKRVPFSVFYCLFQ